jgi:hypothetical protein
MSKLHIPVDQVLDGAKERGLVDAVVIGWDENGELYAASSSGRTEDILETIRALERDLIKRKYAL